MATATVGNHCVTCSKANAVLKCGGCLQDFCYNDFGNHRQELNKQLDEIEINRDLLRQLINEQTTESKKHPLIEQVNQWEQESINKIKQTAADTRKLLLSYTNEHIAQVGLKLNNLTDRLRERRQDSNFMETNLNEWNKQLTELNEELTKPINVKIGYDSTPLVTKIYVDVPVTQLSMPNIIANAKWIQHGITVAGSNVRGSGINQLYNPWGIYVDDDHTVYVADRSNHRIMKWKNGATNGQVVAGGNGRGSRNDQLDNPVNVLVDKQSDCLFICDYGNKRVVRWPCQNGTSGETIISNISCWGLAMDKDGYLYASDVSKHEVRRWKIGDTNGVVVAGGKGQGGRLDQLNCPYYIFVDQDRSVYVSDSNNHRVMKWIEGAKYGIVVAGSHDYGSGLTQLSCPYGVIVDQWGTIYVTDCGNRRVMRWLEGATEGSVVVGGKESGGQSNEFSGPCDLSFDKENNIYVTDHDKHRVQKFNIHSSSDS